MHRISVAILLICIASPLAAQEVHVEVATQEPPHYVGEPVERGVRLAKLIEVELAELPPPPGGDDASATDSPSTAPPSQQASAERQRFQHASGLLQRAQHEMRQVRDFAAKSHLGDGQSADKSDSAGKPIDPADIDGASGPEDAAIEARAHIDRAVDYFQALRRLFFSIAEHLRETAQRQAELNDETEHAAGLLQSDDTLKQLGPLYHRQQELESIARQISAALHEQAKQSPPGDNQQAPDSNPSSKPLEQLKALADQYTKAGKLVDDAHVQMEQAAKHLSEASTAPDDPADRAVTDNGKNRDPNTSGETTNEAGGSDGRHWQIDEARQHQNAALDKLVEALTVLEPPQPQQQQSEQHQQPEGNKSDQSAGHKENKPDQQSAGVDPSRLLQGVRDREAQRRRHNRNHRGRLQQEPVDKDW